jgi:hypothetical protein
VSEQAANIAGETADRIFSLWLDFRQKYNKLLDIADKTPTFATFLKERKIGQIGRLGQLVDVILAKEGDMGVLMHTADGSLSSALLTLNDDGVAIAVERKSVDEALAWTKLAGNSLDQVIKFGIYKDMAPGSLTPEKLQKLLSLDDYTAINRIAKLDPAASDLLLKRPIAQVRNMAQRLTESELAAFSRYQQRLTAAAARRVATETVDRPEVMQKLAPPDVQDAIYASPDQIAALDMLLGSSGLVLDATTVSRDFQIVSDGRVNWRIFWYRYMSLILAGSLAALILVLILRRLLLGPRR